MRWSCFFILTMLVSSLSLAHSQKKLKKEFQGGAPYYELRTSQKGHEYFVVPPGPCSCLTDSQVKCVKNMSALKESLKEEQDKAQQQAKVECLPNAGCSPGVEIIIGICHAS